MEQKPFDKIISTITSRHDPKTGMAQFSPEELDQIKTLINFQAEELDIVMNCCSYIWDQAAFYNLSPEKLLNQLLSHNLAESKAQTFAAVWSNTRGGFITALKDKKFGTPLVLDDIDWALKLTTSSQSLAKTKQLNCSMSLSLVDASDNQGSKGKSVELEFTSQQLLNFFEKLEIIQQQLDSISG